MAQPINWKKNLFFIWLAEICSRAGFSMSLPFMALYLLNRFGMEDEGVRRTWMMWYSTAGSVALFLSFPLWGMVGDRMGRRPMLLRAMFCSGILYASFMFAPTVGILILLRFVTGFFSGTVSPAQALAVSTSPQDKQGFALGVVSSAVWSGNIFGLFGGLVVRYCKYNDFWDRIFGFAHFDPNGIVIRNWGYFVAFSLTMILFLIGGFIVVFFVRENFVPPPPKPVSEKKGFFTGFAGFGCAVYAILGMFLWMSFARRCDESYITFMVEVVSGLKGDQAAHIVTAVAVPAALGSMLSATFIGFFSDRLTMRQLLFPITIIGAIMMTGQALSTAPAMLAAFRFMTFLVVGGLEPVVLGLLSRESPKEKKGTIFGYVASLRILGLMIGTWFGRLVMWIFDSSLKNGITVCGIVFDAHGLGIRSVFLLGAFALLLMIPWLFFVERMVAKRHRQLEQSGN